MMRFYLFVAGLLFTTGMLVGSGFWGGSVGDQVQLIATIIAGVGGATAAGVGFLALSVWKRKAQFEWVDSLLLEEISRVTNIEIFSLEDFEEAASPLIVTRARLEYFMFEDGIFDNDILTDLKQLGVVIDERAFSEQIDMWTDAVDDLFRRIIDADRDHKISLVIHTFKESCVEARRRSAFVRHLQRIRHQVRLAL